MHPRTTTFIAAAALAWSAQASAQSAIYLPSDAYGADRPPAGGAPADRGAADVPGLSVVWRIDGPRHDSPVPARSIQAFSPDGRWLGVIDDRGVRAIDATAATTARAIGHLFGREAYSVAVSPDGRIAVGRAGGVHLYAPGTARAHWITCPDPCGPVTALAFSPDGARLAYQGARGLDARRRGLGSTVVVDAATGARVARLPAPAAKAYVAFSADGLRLTAATTTAFDDVEQYGLSVFRTGDWTLERHLPGSARWWRAVGVVGARHVGAYVEDGRLELGDLSSGRSLWSVPLIRPPLGAPRAAELAATRVELVAVAPNGAFVVSYESPDTGLERRLPGTLVVRETAEGRVEAMYDVADVTSLAVAPDSSSFVYGTGTGRTHRVMARVPR